jgi:sigma-54 dependent transcriptional regulator, acetoin dehydrogenase operon transcriptional activator AcoR
MIAEKKHEKKDYVIRSHERCREYNVEVDRVYSSRIISDKELFEKFESTRELIVTAKPFMDKLYGFVKGSNFFAILTDNEGCILSVIGDEKILSEAFEFKMIPGAYMDEINIGTNAMGTCLEEKGPVLISGDDHYINVYHRWTCSAAPIHNAKGEIIGSLDLTGYSENVHLHTLGMVVAAAHAIEKMLEISNYTDELSMAKLYIETVVDSIPAGIMTTDIEGNIITVNKYVAEMFGYDAEPMKQMTIRNLFEGWDKVKSSLCSNIVFMDEDVYVNAKTNKLQFNLSAYPITDHEKIIRNIIFVFKEVKKVRKLANKIMGRRAIYTFDKIIGKDENFVRVMEFAKKIADSRSNILIMGESGTGKELFAQSIHNYSIRNDEAFIALNCGAIPRELIESELFGYEEGAFTGAKRSGQPGKFEIADSGSIFLDEIGEMPMDMQTRLLRVIEEGTVSRIGSIKESVVDVRVIAATNKDLSDEVRKGNFRKDLFYRLNVLPLYLPPLRQRKADIPLLIQFFVQTLSKKMNKKCITIPEHYMQAMIEYEWPGNIRELENMVEWMINTESFPDKLTLALGNHIEAKEKCSSEYLPSLEQIRVSESLTLDEMEKQHITRVLSQYGGNISLSSKALGIGRSTLYRKMEALGIECPILEQCATMEHQLTN